MVDVPETAAPGFFVAPTGLAAQEGPLALAMRRKIAESMLYAAARRAAPKNVGEGINALGQSIGNMMMMSDLADRERSLRGYQIQTASGQPPLRGAAGAAAPPAVTVPVPRARPAGAPGGPGYAGPGQNDATTAVADAGDTADTEVDPRDSIALADLRNEYARGATPEVAQANPMQAGLAAPQEESGTEDTASRGGQSPDLTLSRRDAIASIESGGRRDPYQTVGVASRNGDRPYGRYQVMGQNIPAWTQAALGQALTPEQFLASPQAQDAVFDHRFGQYADKYGEEGAARAWFGGPGNLNNPNATDKLGTSVGNYGQTYMARLNAMAGQRPIQVASLDPSIGLNAINAVAPDEAADNPPIESDIKPFQVAQAGGVSGPLTPATPAPPPAQTGRFTTPRPYQTLVEPEPPKVPDPTPGQIWAMRVLQTNPDDPFLSAMAKQRLDYENGQQALEWQRRQEAYKAKMEVYKNSFEAEQAFNRGQPARDVEQEKQELALDQAKKEAAQKVQLGGLTPQQYVTDVVQPSQKEAKLLPAAARSVDDARAALNAGIFSGAGANIALNTARGKAALGAPEDPRVSNSQRFIRAFGPQIANMRAAISGNNNISDADVALAERMAGGDLSISPKTMVDLLDKAERANVYNAIEHQKKLARYGGSDPNMRDFVYNAYGLPMQEIVPPAFATRLREQVQKAGDDPEKVKAALDFFDQKFATPGLARKMLGMSNGR